MKCPKCHNLEDRVIDSRQSKDGSATRRRRECTACKHRYTTYEQLEHADLNVVKRDGSVEDFSRDKLYLGIAKAFEKRPFSEQELEQVVEELVTHFESSFEREIPSQSIGSHVMEKLHGLDEVAYMRFASVYRQFQGREDFIDEAQLLGKREKPSALQAELFNR